MLVPTEAPTAHSTAEHGVPGDAAAEPGGVDAVADLGDRPHPFVTDPHRVGRDAIMEVLHLAGEELHIGAADPGAVNVDDHIAGGGDRALHLPHLRVPGPVTTSALIAVG